MESADGKAKLAVWGAYIMQDNFKQESDSRHTYYVHDGWKLSYEKHSATWASFSGSLKDRILYVRHIVLCDDAIGMFSIEYPKAEQKRYGEIVDGLVKSFKSGGKCQ